MKILFTADWHIKLEQKNVPVDWAKTRYRLFFDQIYALEPKVDLHIIGGDLFDRLPSLEELEIFFSFVLGATVRTIIYDGNHEATKKRKTFLSHLREVAKRINPLVEIVTDIRTEENFTILPYCMLSLVDTVDRNDILFTHVRGEIPPHVVPEIDLTLLDKFPLVLAGDLHAHSNSQRNIVYPGAPMTIGFHRTKVDTGYILLDSETLSWDWGRFNLPQLIRKTVSDKEQMVPTNPDHTIYELEGDLASLASVESSPLLDKKIVQRNSDTSLILPAGMSISEEVEEYLLYILELPEDTVSKIIGLFNDYNKNP